MTSGTTQHLYGVWGNSASNVYAVGNSGTVLHFNGTSWSAENSGTTNPLRGVTGDLTTFGYAAGNRATICIRHY
jgi:hypothetical protein